VFPREMLHSQTPAESLFGSALKKPKAKHRKNDEKRDQRRVAPA
jgi:hypothetical protein